METIRDIKFDYITRADGKLTHSNLTLSEIEGGINDDEDYEVVARRQYTGLKDKNDVEIYEGDVVQRFSGSHSYHMFQPVRKKVEWVSTRRYQGFNIGHGQNEFYAWTVIGNIYENPELLEMAA